MVQLDKTLVFLSDVTHHVMKRFEEVKRREREREREIKMKGSPLPSEENGAFAIHARNLGDAIRHFGRL